MDKTIGISGGTGFCGRKIISKAIVKKIKVVSYQRRCEQDKSYTIKEFKLETVFAMDACFFKGLETFVHTAAAVHDKHHDANKYRILNYEATKCLFHKCSEAGVRKFIFFSSVSVYGITSTTDSVQLGSVTNPKNAYAKSKLDAENYLLSQAPFHDIEVLILRLPLIYGEGAPGNLGLITRLARLPVPLPFKGVNNKRSMISVNNVANLIVNIVSGKINLTGIQLIVETKAFSTESIISYERKNKANMLFPFSRSIMKMIFKLIGKVKIYEQLYEDLVFESSKSLHDLLD